MKRIAIDMDEVIADTLPKLLQKIHEICGVHIVPDDLPGRTLGELHPHLNKEIDSIVRDPSFFRDLTPKSGSVQALQLLSTHYELFITTSAMEVPSSFTAKYEWLREYFPFISEMNYVFCGNKSIIHADFLIDDNVRHFENFSGRGVLFTAPHNIHITHYDRLDSWAEAEAYFLHNRQ